MASIETQVLPVRLADSTRALASFRAEGGQSGSCSVPALRFVNRGRLASDYRSLTLLQAR